MGFRNGAYATVWGKNGNVVDDKGNMAIINVSTSKKKTDGSGYETDYSGYVKFIGKAYETIMSVNLQPKDRIKLNAVEVTMTKGKNGQYYVNYICWECEILPNENRPPRNPEVVNFQKELNEIPDSELPF